MELGVVAVKAHIQGVHTRIQVFLSIKYATPTVRFKGLQWAKIFMF